MSDEPVIATNDDASECKKCAVQLGYWKDPYISYFAKSIDRRAPEINRGYYARVRGVERFVNSFLSKAGPRAQIVNLGAGFDTFYWRLKDRGATLSNYVEVDFPTVTANKCHLIRKNKELLQKIHDRDGEIKLNSTDLHAGNYHLLGIDLRNVEQVEIKLLQQAGIDPTLPTMFIAECVLVYIENNCVNRLLRWISSKFRNCVFLNYEMSNMSDTFGDVMFENLRVRGCTLAGISYCKTAESQKGRFLENNWSGAIIRDMVQVYNDLSQEERQRIEKIEFLDEKELLIQLFQHYCICIGWVGSEFSDLNFADEEL